MESVSKSYLLSVRKLYDRDDYGDEWKRNPLVQNQHKLHYNALKWAQLEMSNGWYEFNSSEKSESYTHHTVHIRLGPDYVMVMVYDHRST